jgi:hypothetical protein
MKVRQPDVNPVGMETVALLVIPVLFLIFSAFVVRRRFFSTVASASKDHAE